MATVYAGARHHYFLSYLPGFVIDGGTKGAPARFINHSCEPNCHIEKWWVFLPLLRCLGWLRVAHCPSCSLLVIKCYTLATRI